MLVVALLAVGGVLNHWRNAGLWGESDAMFQMRHDPLAAKDVLGFRQCFVREDSGGLLGARPTRREFYDPGMGSGSEATVRVGRYASQHGWSATGSQRGYWTGERRQVLHRGSVSVRIGPDDTTVPMADPDCWLMIEMSA
ncbi:hypothetical protein BWX38_10125 [Acidipropionibacterium acidipropionici]|nr:hypothetical protein BWX38_10125 [Acidipropionibacterium acidipropionici]